MWIFNPIYKCTIWGGKSLKTFKNDHRPEAPDCKIGESWEISDVEGDVSIVSEGPDTGANLDSLIKKYGASLLGKKIATRFGTRFPLLVKLIDASADLSIQVHPDDEMAQRIGHPFGKNEMWIVLDANDGARLANGFKYPIRRVDLKHLVDTGLILDTLRFVNVKQGDAFFIPAGRVHAIGNGLLIAEIQQTSNDTFRLYDYMRTDEEGNLRELHLTQASEAINYMDTDGLPLRIEKPHNGVGRIFKSKFFNVNSLECDSELTRNYADNDSFTIIMATEGKALLTTKVNTVALEKGNTVLLAAAESELTISPEGNCKFKALEIYI